jgi:signal transduction protein with GAF and PtsI domain
MSPAAVPRIKQVVRTLDSSAARIAAREAVEARSAEDVRAESVRRLEAADAASGGR